MLSMQPMRITRCMKPFTRDKQIDQINSCTLVQIIHYFYTPTDRCQRRMPFKFCEAILQTCFVILALPVNVRLTHPALQMIHSAGSHGSQLATPFLEASCHGFLVISHLFCLSADQTLAVSYLQHLLHTENDKRKAFKLLNASIL